MSDSKSVLLEAVRNGNLEAVEELPKSFRLGSKDKKKVKFNHLSRQDKYDVFMEAVLMKQLDVVKLFISSGLNFANNQNFKTATPLHIAIKNDDVEMFKLLLANGADVKSMDQDERTPLCLAAKLGKIELVKIILEPYEDQLLVRKQVTDHKGKHGTALHEAIINDRMEIIKLLLEDYKCDPQGLEVAVKEGKINVMDSYIDEQSISAEQKLDRIEWLFHQAVLAGQINIVEHLLKTRQVDVNKRDKSNNYAIEAAIKSCNERMVDFLLERGANCRNGAVLCTAVQHNQCKLLRKFLEMDVLDVNANSLMHGAIAPLHIAAKRHCVEGVKILLEHKANVNVRTWNGQTPLHSAAESGSTEIAKILLDHGASVNALSESSDTSPESIAPLHVAVRYKNFKMVKLLLEYKADVTIESESLTTPLEWAACFGYQEIAALLLDKGVFHGDSRQRRMLSAIHFAVEQNKLEMVKLLLNRGVSLEPSDEPLVYTPLLHSAAENGNLQIFKILLPEVLASRGDVNNRDVTSATALHEVVTSEMKRNTKTKEEKEEIAKEIIEVLLANGADINAKNEFGMTPLHQALTSSHIWRAVFLINKGADFNIGAEEDWSIIDCCVSAGRVGHAKELVKEIVWRVHIENADLSQDLLRKIKNDGNVKKFYDRCVKETQKLEKEKFSKVSVTLADIMRTKNVNRLVAYTRNRSIDDYLESGYFRLKFIIYGQTIQDHFVPALFRRNLLEHQNVKDFFNFLPDGNGTSLPNLPATFTNEVFGHLNNEDLENLTKASRFVKVKTYWKCQFCKFGGFIHEC